MEVITQVKIKESILILRGHRVLLNSDLATIYGVTTKYLNVSDLTAP